jgi:hypothetical protein
MSVILPKTGPAPFLLPKKKTAWFPAGFLPWDAASDDNY